MRCQGANVVRVGVHDHVANVASVAPLNVGLFTHKHRSQNEDVAEHSDPATRSLADLRSQASAHCRILPANRLDACIDDVSLLLVDRADVLNVRVDERVVDLGDLSAPTIVFPSGLEEDRHALDLAHRLELPRRNPVLKNVPLSFTMVANHGCFAEGFQGRRIANPRAP